jgi:peptide/nickel transport system substrate-binding protein
MILTMWAADYPDADAFVHALLHRQEGLLGPFCGSEEVDRLAMAARVEQDHAARSALYRQIEDVVAREAVLLPLFHPQKYRFALPGVEGLAVNGLSFPVVPYDEIWLHEPG